MSEKERSKIQNRVDASREQSGAAGLIERSSTDENNNVEGFGSATYHLNIKQIYISAGSRLTNTAKLFLDSTFAHQYSEMRMLLDFRTDFNRPYVCSADVHEQIRDRKKRMQESFTNTYCS